MSPAIVSNPPIFWRNYCIVILLINTQTEPAISWYFVLAPQELGWSVWGLVLYVLAAPSIRCVLLLHQWLYLSLVVLASFLCPCVLFVSLRPFCVLASRRPCVVFASFLCPSVPSSLRRFCVRPSPSSFDWKFPGFPEEGYNGQVKMQLCVSIMAMAPWPLVSSQEPSCCGLYCNGSSSYHLPTRFWKKSRELRSQHFLNSHKRCQNYKYWWSMRFSQF